MEETSLAVKEETFPVYNTIQEAITSMLKKSIVVRDEKGRWTREGVNIRLEEVLNLLIVSVYEYNRNIPIVDGKKLTKSWSISKLKHDLREYIDTAHKQTMTNLENHLRHNGKDPHDPALKIIQKLGAKEEKQGLATAALLHWSWCVKRRLYGMDVGYSLMLCLYGTQGIGKTYFVRKYLCKIFKNTYLEACLDQILDDREVFKWTKYLIASFDELGALYSKKLTKFQRTKIRNKLIEDDITYREMYSKNYKTVKRTYTAISNSSKHLWNVFKDGIGMELFFELEVFPPEGEKHFNEEELNNIDFDLFWQSVDENLSKGYLYPGSEFWEELQKVQATYIPLSTPKKS